MACQIRNAKSETRKPSARAMSQNVSLCLTAAHVGDGQNLRGRRLVQILCWRPPGLGQGGEHGKTDKNVCPTNDCGRSGALTLVDACLPHASGSIIKSKLNERSHETFSRRTSQRNLVSTKNTKDTKQFLGSPSCPSCTSWTIPPRPPRLRSGSAFPRIPRNSPSRRIVSTKRKSPNEAKFGHNGRHAKALPAFESPARRVRRCATGRERGESHSSGPQSMPRAGIDLAAFLPPRRWADRMLGSLPTGRSGRANEYWDAGTAWMAAIFQPTGHAKHRTISRFERPAWGHAGSQI